MAYDCRNHTSALNSDNVSLLLSSFYTRNLNIEQGSGKKIDAQQRQLIEYRFYMSLESDLRKGNRCGQCCHAVLLHRCHYLVATRHQAGVCILQEPPQCRSNRKWRSRHAFQHLLPALSKIKGSVDILSVTSLHTLGWLASCKL